MKVSFSLLNNYVNISDLAPIDIANVLTLAGLEVDNIENETPSFTGVIAAIVEKNEPHPNADKLQIATVFDGKERFQVVCGAPNCREGLHTAFAPIGATLTDARDGTKEVFKIKKCKLRSIESFGMLCSKKELGLGDDADGIWELDKNIPLGQVLEDQIDPIFDISLTPNLGRCMNIIGIAKEIGAILSRKVTVPQNNFNLSPDIKTDEKIDIQIKDNMGCKRYSALYIENVTITPSPLWLKEALEKCSMRSVNSIVDIMNFVMIEMGQPLHAFDYDQIFDKTIIVDTLKEEKNVVCLDDIKRTIKPNTLVIEDKKNILAVAGVIGAKESATSDKTKNILIESAYFDPLYIRKSQRNTSLRTESSLRFEKNIDIDKTLAALDRAAHYIALLNPNCKIASNTVDIKTFDIIKKKIPCRPSRINRILGTNLSQNEIIEIFHRLEIETKTVKNKKGNNEDVIECIIPTSRNDISLEIDLVEEVARIYGYNNIEKKLPTYTTSTLPDSSLYIFEKKLRATLASLGLKEIITPDLISPKMVEILENSHLPKNAIIQALHYKSIDQSILRPSLLPSFLQVIKHNNYQNNFNLHFFEIGKIHYKDNNNIIEKPSFAMSFTGENAPLFWKDKSRKMDFYDLKGTVENLFKSLNISSYSFEPSKHPCFHPGQQATIYINNVVVGIIGTLHIDIQKKYDIKNEIFFAELDTTILEKNEEKQKRFSSLPEFPSSERDWTLGIKKNVNITSILNGISSKLLEKASIIDIYSDPKDTDEKDIKITLRFVYRNKTKTISSEEVEKEHEKIIKHVSQQLIN